MEESYKGQFTAQKLSLRIEAHIYRANKHYIPALQKEMKNIK